MSAFVVDKAHIDALVGAIVWGPKGATGNTWRLYDPDTEQPLTVDDADRVGVELWNENVRSVAYRYPQDTGSGDRPGPCDFSDDQVPAYTFPITMTARLSAAECLKATHCLRYQSCEHPQWQGSRAERILDTLAHQTEGYVEGYEQAPWEIERHRVSA